MYNPCISCPKVEYRQSYCSEQCEYGKDMTELKMLREQIEHQTPIPIEQLKEWSGNADGITRHWVWIEILDDQLLNPGCGKVSAYYRVQYDYTHGEALVCGYPGISYAFDYVDYGKKWAAYSCEVKHAKN